MAELADAWAQVTTTLAAEFSDVPDAAQLTRIVVRLCMAALLGSLLGWEREHAGKAAGVRTHMLVAMGPRCSCWRQSKRASHRPTTARCCKV